MPKRISCTFWPFCRLFWTTSSVCYSGGSEPIFVEEISWHNPNLIILSGKDQDLNECTVLVHMSALALVLKRIKVSQPVQHKPIGFLGCRDADQK